MDEYSILRKKRRKNAFAATSLLISIAIALLVLVGAVLILGKVDNQKLNAVNDDSNVTLGSGTDVTCVGLTKEMVFDTNIRNIKEAAISYFTNERLPKNIGDTVKITLKEMQDKKIILNVIDASAKLCNEKDTYVEVTKEKNEYVMKINLSCSDKEDYVLVHLGCYDYCDSNICEKKEDIKEYEYEYKKTTNCVMSPWSNWGNWTLKREKTSNLKKEDTKVETSVKEVVDTKSATKNPVTYNCNKYPGYKLVGDKCIKETITKDVKEATPSKYSYTCSQYPGYELVGDKCVKKVGVTEVINATMNPITYTCPNGYTLNGTKCSKMVTITYTNSGVYTCPSGYTLNGTKCSKTTTMISTEYGSYVCPSGYTLSDTKCYKSIINTDTIDAEAVYATKTTQETYTCYKNECTTKTVFSCPTGKSCGNYPQTSCEKKPYTCTKDNTTTYIDHYTCPVSYYLNGTKCIKTILSTDTKNATLVCPSGYTVNGTKCIKTITSTDTKNATLVCPSGYSVNGDVCVKYSQEKVVIDATKDPITYSCKSGYSLQGTKCIRDVIKIDTKEATKISGGYICPSGYTQDGKTCTKTTTTKDVKNADSSKITYTCPSGYTLNGTSCTKKVSKTIKTTYYRYATRSCNGGSTSIKWSTSKNDSILLNDGYKLTGNKKEIIVK